MNYVDKIFQRKYSIYIWIALVVILFNIIAVLGFDALFHDDPAHYKRYVEGSLFWHKFKYNLLAPFKCLFQWSIAFYSPKLMRGILVILLMVPLSWSFFYLFHNKFGFSRTCAFAAAVIPNSLPFQWEIPAGINMSYTLYGLLFSIMSLLVGFSYLEKSDSWRWRRFFGALFLFFISTLFMEQSVFLFPPLALAYLGYTKLNKKHLWLISSMFGLTLAKYIMIKIVEREPITEISTGGIIKRVGLYFKSGLPSPGDPLYVSLLAILIISAGFLVYIKQGNEYPRVNKNFAHFKPKLYIVYLYSFLICWAFSTIFAFLVASAYFVPRYSHISSFGLNAVVIISIYSILDRNVFKRVKLPQLIIIGLIIFSGVFRFTNLRNRFQSPNETVSIVARDLNQVHFPLNSQIVISGLTREEVGNPGGWNRSSGYLKFILKRADVNGLIGEANSGNFSSHFNPKRVSKSGLFKMSGLSLNKPLYLFLFDREKGRLSRQKYSLEWRGQSKYASWTIYGVNVKTGKISPFKNGAGLKEYLKTIKNLKKRGIYQQDIVWGWPLSKQDQERLEDSKLLPKILRGDVINQFKKIDTIKANLVMRISKSVGNISGKAQWGDDLQSLATFTDKVTLNRKREKILLYFLFKSLDNYRISDFKLRIQIKDKNTNLFYRIIPFGIEGEDQTINAGDFILGCVLLPKKKFQKIESLNTAFCRVSILFKGSKYPLKVQKGRSRKKKGSSLIIPLNRIMPEIDKKIKVSE